MTDNEAPDPRKILKLARQAMSSSEYRRKFHMADFWGVREWYEPQLRFFAAGTKHHQRLIRGGNQSGKSLACAFEAALHMTGAYPRWWPGRRFNKPTRGWVIGPERTLVRDGPQKKLTAMGGEFGTGCVPLSAFAGRPIMVPGGGGCIDTMSVAHETNGERDGVSTVTYKSFEQGAEKMQAESIDWIWVDERCSEEIYSELIARTSATDGILFLSYTPLKGGGQLTYRFLNEYSPDRCDIRITGVDAKHISPARREELAEAYLEHEKSARLEGIPMLGVARVFPFPLETLMRDFNRDTDIKSWARWIVGVDFGYGHAFGAALCAWVHDSEEFFVVDGFKMERTEALYHTKRIAGICRGLRIPAGEADARRICSLGYPVKVNFWPGVGLWVNGSQWQKRHKYQWASAENDGAEIAPLSIDRMVEHFGDVAVIRDALLARDDLPAATRQNLVTRLSQTLAGFVVDRAWLEEDRARRIAREACEKATVTIAAGSPKTELGPLIRHLCASGQLTAGLVLRALLSGNITLFEEALAELSGMPLGRVSALVHDRIGSGLRPLFEKAQLPASMHAAFKEAIKAMRDGFAEGADDARLQRRMVERVLAACESADTGDVAPLITLLRRFATEAAREEARLFCDEIAEPLRLIYSAAA